MRLACDTGGTFTDLLVEDDDGLRMYKAHTTPGDPAKGVLDALGLAAADRGLELEAFLAQGALFVHGTTHAINAIVTVKTARTALLTTAGHPDILVLREGGRPDPFDHKTPYPEPYIPRGLTFEIPERMDAEGAVVRAFDEAAALAVIAALKARDVEAVAVCFLWSILNPAHELAMGELLRRHMPEVPFTLSHQLNPVAREYRRAAATAIDASLKPLMGRYLGGLESRLREAGFTGRLLVLTSQGGALDARQLAGAPVHAINSGPSMAPVAGRYYARAEGGADSIIVADTGGTTYDVSLVRDDEIPWTRETWIGAPFLGHMTGFPSVDVKSVGAGGGSIAWVDHGGLLHVGPRSAGSTPGPACYGRGGTEPTVTDACVALGYIDPDFFLGGALKLDVEAARAAVRTHVAEPLGVDVEHAAASIISVVTEGMVQAIADITVNQGVDPRQAMLIGGGGAAGLNSVWIARRLGCERLVFPEAGATLSAAGALISDLVYEARGTLFTATDGFDYDGANRLLARLGEDCLRYARTAGERAIDYVIGFAAEARYPGQVWDIEASLASAVIHAEAVAGLERAFHAAHARLFATNDPTSAVEVTAFVARVRCRLRDSGLSRLRPTGPSAGRSSQRRAYFPGTGWVDTPAIPMHALEPGREHRGPAIVETPFTTIVVDPHAHYAATSAGALVVRP